MEPRARRVIRHLSAPEPKGFQPKYRSPAEEDCEVCGQRWAANGHALDCGARARVLLTQARAEIARLSDRNEK